MFEKCFDILQDFKREIYRITIDKKKILNIFIYIHILIFRILVKILYQMNIKFYYTFLLFSSPFLEWCAHLILSFVL